MGLISYRLRKEVTEQTIRQTIVVKRCKQK